MKNKYFFCPYFYRNLDAYCQYNIVPYKWSFFALNYFIFDKNMQIFDQNIDYFNSSNCLLYDK